MTLITDKSDRNEYYRRMAGIGVVVGLLGFLAFVLLTSCSAPPTKAEQSIFDVRTNVLTNVVAQTSGTNVVWLTNLVEVTAWSIRTNVVEAIGKAGEIGNVFAPGLGTLGASLLTALLGIWGTARRKNGQIKAITQVAETLTQTIQVGRELLSRTPQGAQAALAWKEWMEKHQKEENIMEKVIEIMKLGVDRNDAAYTADQLLKLMADVKAGNVPPPTS